MSEPLKQIISGKWVSNPAISNKYTISAVIDVPDRASLLDPAPRWVWRLLYVKLFPRQTVLSVREVESNFCNAVMIQFTRERKLPCIKYGVPKEELFADHPGYKNIKIAVNISGEGFEIVRLGNVFDMTYTIYGDDLALRSLHCYVSTSAYKVLSGEKYMK